MRLRSTALSRVRLTGVTVLSVVNGHLQRATRRRVFTPRPRPPFVRDVERQSRALRQFAGHFDGRLLPRNPTRLLGVRQARVRFPFLKKGSSVHRVPLSKSRQADFRVIVPTVHGRVFSRLPHHQVPLCLIRGGRQFALVRSYTMVHERRRRGYIGIVALIFRSITGIAQRAHRVSRGV